MKLGTQRSQYNQNAVYPINSFYCLNLDLNNGSSVDIAGKYNIDKEFLLMLVQEKNFKPSLFRLEVYDSSIEERLEEDITSGLLDDIENENFYFTSDKLGVSFNLPHAYGSHIQFEIPYDEIAGWVVQTGQTGPSLKPTYEPSELLGWQADPSTVDSYWTVWESLEYRLFGDIEDYVNVEREFIYINSDVQSRGMCLR